MAEQLHPDALRDLERPTVEVAISGVPATTYVLLVPAPGGLSLHGTDDIKMPHMAKAFRQLADALEETHGTVCHCRECGS